jgi:hypothetical protein
VSPFFQKTRVINIRLTHKNVKSMAASKGLKPLGEVWGGAPKELCVHRALEGGKKHKNFTYPHKSHASEIQQTKTN